LKKLLPKGSYVQTADDEYSFERHFELWFCVSMSDGYFTIDDKRVEPFEIGLNTAFAIGNDALKFAARVHGQCEIHCYIEGPNKKWLAEIIRNALKANIYREKMGWESVITLLEENDIAPVVLSYSVCDQFPNSGIADWTDDKNGDDWYKLSEEEKWRLAMIGVRERKGLEIKPDDWDDFFFEDGVDAFDLVEKVKIN
jgi:hypothetical protein